MSLDLLFPNFDDLIRTRENVERFREAILQLAVHGRLVPQDPTDEPAVEMVTRIRAEKLRLEAQGKSRRSRKVASSPDIEGSTELPRNWVCVSLREIAHVGTGATPLRSEARYYENGTIPWITSSATNSLYIDQASEFVTDQALAESNLTLYPKHTLIVAMYGQGKTRGQVSELLIESTTNQACAAIVMRGEAAQLREYVKLFFQWSYERIRSLAEGGAQPNLNLEKIATTAIPLPPLSEQRRIVAKVTHLMSLCDALEAKLHATQTACSRLTASTLHRLQTADDDAELHSAWTTVADNFDLLYDDPRNVAELRQTILQLAIRGKLVPQDPTDEPVVEISRSEGEGYSSSRGKKKARVPSSRVESDRNNVHFDLPMSWAWTTLRDVSVDIQYGYTASAEYSTSDYRLLRITDIQDDRVNWSEVPGCTIGPAEAEKFLLKKDDIVIARTGGTVGKSFLVNDLTVNAVFASYLIRVRPTAQISATYLKIFLSSPLYWSQLIQMSKGTGQPNVNATSLSQLQIPLPPLAEQKRVVAKVNQLMSRCDALEAKLHAAEAARSRLTAAVLHGVANGSPQQ